MLLEAFHKIKSDLRRIFLKIPKTSRSSAGFEIPGSKKYSSNVKRRAQKIVVSLPWNGSLRSEGQSSKSVKQEGISFSAGELQLHLKWVKCVLNQRISTLKSRARSLENPLQVWCVNEMPSVIVVSLAATVWRKCLRFGAVPNIFAFLKSLSSAVNYRLNENIFYMLFFFPFIFLFFF